jgi:hypothetical protein
VGRRENSTRLFKAERARDYSRQSTRRFKAERARDDSRRKKHDYSRCWFGGKRISSGTHEIKRRHRQTEGHTYRQVGRQRPTGRKEGRQVERPTGRKEGRQRDRQADKQTGRQTGRQTDRQTDRQTATLYDNRLGVEHSIVVAGTRRHQTARYIALVCGVCVCV